MTTDRYEICMGDDFHFDIQKIPEGTYVDPLNGTFESKLDAVDRLLSSLEYNKLLLQKSITRAKSIRRNIINKVKKSG